MIITNPCSLCVASFPLHYTTRSFNSRVSEDIFNTMLHRNLKDVILGLFGIMLLYTCSQTFSSAARKHREQGFEVSYKRARSVNHGVLQLHGRPVVEDANIDKTFSNFGEIIIWGWVGVYHQIKELKRVLGREYNVTSQIFQNLPPTDPANDSALYIIIPAHSLGTLPPHYILYQTEQWGHHMLDPFNAVWANQRGNATRQTTMEAFEGAIEVWDYSRHHTLLYPTTLGFQESSIRFRHVPFSWFPVPPAFAEHKDIAVLHYGLITKGNRRQVILEELHKRGLEIQTAPYDIWGEHLTALLARSKIVLNLHYYEAKILETCRIMEAISLGAMVITEPGADSSQQHEWEGKLVFAEGIDDMYENIQLYTKDEDARKQRHLTSWEHAQEHYNLQDYLSDIL